MREGGLTNSSAAGAAALLLARRFLFICLSSPPILCLALKIRQHVQRGTLKSIPSRKQATLFVSEPVSVALLVGCAESKAARNIPGSAFVEIGRASGRERG